MLSIPFSNKLLQHDTILKGWTSQIFFLEKIM